MDALAILFGFLGATGLGAILKIVLAASSKQQELSSQNLTENTDRIVNALERQGDQTRLFMRDQAKIVRDGHRQLAVMLQLNPKTAKAGRDLDKVMQDIEERTNNE